MKKHLFGTLLCIGAAFAFTSAIAQTATPTPTASATPTPTATATPVPVGSIYADQTKKTAARIADAQAYLPTLTDPVKIEDVSYTLDMMLLTSGNVTWSVVQPVAESLIANAGLYFTGPTAGTGFTSTRQDNIFLAAVNKKQSSGIPLTADKMAFVLGIIDGLSPDASDSVINGLNLQYVHLVNTETTDLIKVGKYADALANALQPCLLNSGDLCSATIKNVLTIKTITHAPDVLPWAKLVYVMGSFGDSSRTSVLVANAFRATSGMAVANDFISSQTDDTITNPLSGVGFPAAFTTGPLPEPAYAGLNILLRGDAKGSLAYFRAQYDTATSNTDLSNAGAAVGAALRNFHGNLIRANEFIDSNKPAVAGQPTPAPFVFTELQ